MKKSLSGPSSPENKRRIVSGSITVNVADASMDMFTPPCSPNSCRALASAWAGSDTAPVGFFDAIITQLSLGSSSSMSFEARFLGFGLGMGRDCMVSAIGDDVVVMILVSLRSLSLSPLWKRRRKGGLFIEDNEILLAIN